jgi:hypothetical protein
MKEPIRSPNRSKVGAKGRRKFEKFLREVGELDDEDDVIDVESK